MAKRLRSLASLLWDTDSCSDSERAASGTLDLKLENARLRGKVRDLEGQVQLLEDAVVAARSMPCPIQEQHPQCADHWTSHLRPDVLALPRLWADVVPSLEETLWCHQRIEMDLPRNPKASASQLLAHAEARILQLSSKHPAVFKIGITWNPCKRWMHPTYGYCQDRRERWDKMKVLSVASCSFSTALIESVLIKKFRGSPGCRNEHPGGETACPGEGPHFTYVVYRILVPPRNCPSAKRAVG